MRTGSERWDDLGRGGFKILQDTSRFCFGTDAVLLAWFCKVKPSEKLLDLGTGNGILPILIAARSECNHIRGLEIQSREAELARISAAFNGLDGRIAIDEGDIRDAAKIYGGGAFDVVVTNPPYYAKKIDNPTAKEIACNECLCNLSDVIKAAAAALRNGGRLYMVHKAERLADVIAACRERGIEVKTLRLVYPRAGKDAELVLIYGKKGGRAGLIAEPPLVIYGGDGLYTKETEDIYNG